MKNVTDSAPSSEGLVFDAPPSEPFDLKFESGIDDALSLARSDPQTCAQARLEALHIAIADSGRHEPGPDWIDLAAKFILLPGEREPGEGLVEYMTVGTFREACSDLVDSRTATRLRGLFIRIASHGLHLAGSKGATGSAYRRAYKSGRRSSARIGRAALSGFLAVAISRAKGVRREDCIACLRGLANIDNLDFDMTLDREDEVIRTGLEDLPGWPSWAKWVLDRLDRLDAPLRSESDLIWDDDFKRKRAGYSEWLARNEWLMTAGAAASEPPDTPTASIELRTEDPPPTPPDVPSAATPTYPNPNTNEYTCLKNLMAAGMEFVPEVRLLKKGNRREAIRRLRQLGWPIESARAARRAGKPIPPDAKGYRLDPDMPCDVVAT